jgi:excisionase family DNA binding protein
MLRHLLPKGKGDTQGELPSRDWAWLHGLPEREGEFNHGVSMLRSVKEAAGDLAVGRDSVVRLIKRGELKAIVFPRMGGKGKNVKRMIEDTEIESFKQQHKKK